MITIADKQYTVPPPTAMRSFALQQRILPVASNVARLFASLLDMGPNEDFANIGEMDIMKVFPRALPHLGRIFSEMPPGELEWITRELLRDATMGDAKVKLFGTQGGDAFDGLFRGRTWDTWKLLAHALEVWYPDFFESARGFLVRAGEVNGSPASSTSAPPGPASA